MKEKFEAQPLYEIPQIKEEFEDEKKLDPKPSDVLLAERVFAKPEVKEAMTGLVEKLEPNLESAEKIYDTLLSDDASGRLITLFLRNIINKQREVLGKERAKTFFIMGGRHKGEEVEANIGDFLEKNKEKIGKTLLVTEYIETGLSIERISHLLDEQAIKYDIASLSIDKHFLKNYPPSWVAKRKGMGNFYYGSVGEVGARSFHGMDLFSGIEKGKSTGPFPSKIKYEPYQKSIAAARIVIRRMSDEIYKKVFE